MNEEEFKEKLEKGEIEEVKIKERKEAPAPIPTGMILEDYITQLEDLRMEKVRGDIILIKSETFTNSFNITGLDGDRDGFYLLFIKARHSSAFALNMRFNGDAGSNYHMLKHYNSRQSGVNYHGVDNASSLIQMPLHFVTQQNYLAKILIYAKAGAVRQTKSECFGWTDWTTYCDDSQGAFIWTNVSANITEINIISGIITFGEYKLYKLK